jgi:hypothetical protein
MGEVSGCGRHPARSRLTNLVSLKERVCRDAVYAAQEQQSVGSCSVLVGSVIALSSEEERRESSARGGSETEVRLT